MKALIYISKANVDFDDDTLLVLAERAAARNAEYEITGYLWFKKGQFVQYLEGEGTALDTLMLRIKEDERHQVLHQVEAPLDCQRFPDWHMRYLNSVCEISLDSILSDQLLLLNTAYQTDEILVNGVWRIVDSIANHIS